MRGVLLRGTSWSQEKLDDSGDPFGLLVPSGSTSQLFPIRESGINQVSVRFSSSVNIRFHDLILLGTNDSTFDLVGFAYDATSFTATWTLAEVIEDDQLQLLLVDRVTDGEGHRLDGDWLNGVDSFVEGSGNGIPGGLFDFSFRIDVSADPAAVVARHIFYNNSAFDTVSDECRCSESRQSQ